METAFFIFVCILMVAGGLMAISLAVFMATTAAEAFLAAKIAARRFRNGRY